MIAKVSAFVSVILLVGVIIVGEHVFNADPVKVKSDASNKPETIIKKEEASAFNAFLEYDEKIIDSVEVFEDEIESNDVEADSEYEEEVDIAFGPTKSSYDSSNDNTSYKSESKESESKENESIKSKEESTTSIRDNDKKQDEEETVKPQVPDQSEVVESDKDIGEVSVTDNAEDVEPNTGTGGTEVEETGLDELGGESLGNDGSGEFR